MNTLTMARRKKEVTPNRQLAQAILDQYHPKSVEDMQEALKDIFGPMFEAMLQGEMNSHLGDSNNERGEKIICKPEKRSFQKDVKNNGRRCPY